MFSSTGLFRNIICPRQYDCSVPNCIFSHESNTGADALNYTGNHVYDPTSAGEIEPPPLKKRRIEAPSARVREAPLESSPQVPVINDIPQSDQPRAQSKPPAPRKSTLAPVRKTQTISSVQPVSVTRDVSPPPPKKTPNKSLALPAEKLIPRQVPHAPAVLKTRLSLVELFYKQMKALNSRAENEKNISKHLILSEQELIRAALDEEEEGALKLGGEIYRNAMSQRVLRLKKMSLDDWKKLIQERYRSQPSSSKTVSSQSSAVANDRIKTDLSSAQEVKILRMLETKLEGLELHGYVTDVPSAAEIQKAKDGFDSAGGYETCDRCGTRFQVFPGRNGEGQLTTRGTCYHHWAKLNRQQTNKDARMYGHSEAYYPCCNKPTGSEGCTKGETHVFKVTDVKRLATLLQFEKTPSQPGNPRHGPVAFDCEMGYTTYGLELIRVTAVSWPEHKELLDVLVRPYGEILDLNTRFSGVSKEQFATAPLYEDRAPVSTESVVDKTELSPKSLCKVTSPAAARSLLFGLLTPTTPLIGHAIDNDLNACRIVHPCIVDTVLLYPHPRGLPIRYGLKMLTAKYLDRGIQQGGADGHDSKEDSIATGDLVRFKVAEKWNRMKLEGWRFDGELLIEPGKRREKVDVYTEN